MVKPLANTVSATTFGTCPPWHSGVLIAGGRVITSTVNANGQTIGVSSYNASSHERVWFFDFKVPAPSRFTQANNPVLTVDGSTVVAQDGAGNVFGIDARSGEKEFLLANSYGVDRRITTQPLVSSEGYIYIIFEVPLGLTFVSSYRFGTLFWQTAIPYPGVAGEMSLSSDGHLLKFGVGVNLLSVQTQTGQIVAGQVVTESYYSYRLPFSFPVQSSDGFTIFNAYAVPIVGRRNTTGTGSTWSNDICGPYHAEAAPVAVVNGVAYFFACDQLNAYTTAGVRIWKYEFSNSAKRVAMAPAVDARGTSFWTMFNDDDATLWILVVDKNGKLTFVPNGKGSFENANAISIGPNGYLYMCTQEGKIWSAPGYPTQ